MPCNNVASGNNSGEAPGANLRTPICAHTNSTNNETRNGPMRAGKLAFFPSDANTYAAPVINAANNTKPNSLRLRATANGETVFANCASLHNSGSSARRC